MKRFMLYIISILVVFTFVFPLGISADKPVGVIRDFSFESNVVTKVHELNKPDIFVLDPLFGVAEIFPGEGHSGLQSIHLQANSREYSNVYSAVKGPLSLDEISELSFWYKHFPDSEQVTPFLVLWFELDSGGYLCIIQNPFIFLGINTEWTEFDSDIWSYITYDSDWNMMVTDRGPFLLSQIQDMFDGQLLKNEGSVGIAAGFWGYYCNALVDDLTIITYSNLNKVKK